MKISVPSSLRMAVNFFFSFLSSNPQSTSNFFLNGDEIILYLSIGDSHLSFLSSLGYVYIFGNNSYGQIGNFTNGNYSNTPFRLIV